MGSSLRSVDINTLIFTGTILKVVYLLIREIYIEGVIGLTKKDVSTVYHYCSLETFLSIIKNKTIRLSDVNKSNDYLETKAVLNLIKEAAINIYKKSPISDRGMLIYGMKDEDAIKYLVDVALNRILKFNNLLVYTACFSEEEDLLSQWRGYADNGKGVAIGFNLNCLKKICETTKLLKLEKVIYTSCESDLCNAIVCKYANMIVDDIIRALLKGNINELLTNPHGPDPFSSLTQQALILDSVFVKHHSFSEENEWRIVLNDELSKDSNEWDMLYNWSEKVASSSENIIYKLFPKALQFRSTGNDIISYLDLCYEAFIEDIISSIVIGPNCKLQKDDVNQIFCHFGYELDYDRIILSKSTYREK